MRLALIDFDSAMWVAAYHLRETEVNEFSLMEAAIELEGALNEIMMRTNCDHYILFIGGFGRNFRYDIASTYKSNRKERPPYMKVWEKPLKDLISNKLKGTLCHEMEADDAMRIFGLKYPEAILVHVDKDLNQIAGQHFNPSSKQHYTVSEEDAYTALWKQVVKGDSTDGIKGAPSIGEKTADQYFEGMPQGKLPSVALATYRVALLKQIQRSRKELNDRQQAALAEYLAVQEFYTNYMLICMKPVMDTVLEVEIVKWSSANTVNTDVPQPEPQINNASIGLRGLV